MALGGISPSVSSIAIAYSTQVLAHKHFEIFKHLKNLNICFSDKSDACLLEQIQIWKEGSRSHVCPTFPSWEVPAVGVLSCTYLLSTTPDRFHIIGVSQPRGDCMKDNCQGEGEPETCRFPEGPSGHLPTRSSLIETRIPGFSFLLSF